MKVMTMMKMVMKILFALLFVAGGVMHFANPDFYLAMMPDYLPMHRELVYLSGVAEIALGAALLVPRTSRAAAWGLIALLIAVFPANINMALHPERWPDVAPAALYARLPLQGLLIWWAWVYARPRR